MYNGYYRELEDIRRDVPNASFGFLENIELSDESCLYDYLHGYCDEFAAGLSDYYGYAIEYVINNANVLVHAYCVADIAGTTAYIDARGVTTNARLFFDEFSDFCTFEDGNLYDVEGECAVFSCVDAAEMYDNLHRIPNQNKAFVRWFEEKNSYYDTKAFERELGAATLGSNSTFSIAPSAKTEKQRLNEALQDKAHRLDKFFAVQKMDDIEVDVKNGHLFARDEDGNRWKDEEIYDFVLNDCLVFERNGSLAFGLDDSFPLDDIVADAKGFGVEITSYVSCVDNVIDNAIARAAPQTVAPKTEVKEMLGIGDK